MTVWVLIIFSMRAARLTLVSVESTFIFSLWKIQKLWKIIFLHIKEIALLPKSIWAKSKQKRIPPPAVTVKSVSLFFPRLIEKIFLQLRAPLFPTILFKEWSLV